MWGVGGRSSRHGSPLLPQVLTPPPCLLFLPSWPPSLAAILLPVVYFLFCFSAEEMGGEYPWPANLTCRFSSTLCRKGYALWGRETVSKPNQEQSRIRWRFSSLDEIKWLGLMCALPPHVRLHEASLLGFPSCTTLQELCGKQRGMGPALRECRMKLKVVDPGGGGNMQAEEALGSPKGSGWFCFSSWSQT